MKALLLVALVIGAAPATAQHRVIPTSEIKSGFEFLGPDLKNLQQDDFANPGTLWVDRGEKLWRAAAGGDGKSCADCHGDARTSMTGVAVRYPKIDGPARRNFDLGEAFFVRRRGQLNLACTHCHDANWGRTLFAERISQGHPNAWPAYRLDWQTLGSLERRLRACLSGVRAEILPYGSPEYTDLALYLSWRARGLPIESPGVRR